MPIDIGFRIVVAPGDMSFFEDHFFLSGSTRLQFKGKIYELIGANSGSFTWELSEKYSKLLGGRLAEFENQAQLDFFAKNMPLATGGWGCFIGGKKINGKWMWIHSRKEIDFGKWYLPPQKETGKYLTIRNRKWKSEHNYLGPIFLCEWDEKDYPNRNEQIKSGKPLPMELTRFSIGNRNFMLINSTILWCTAYRFCELMGGRLACLDTPEIKQQVIEKLSKFRDKSILLGGYAKFGKWYWINGKPVLENLKKDTRLNVPSLNRNFITLKDGNFYNSQLSKLFLLEWFSSSDSSIKR